MKTKYRIAQTSKDCYRIETFKDGSWSNVIQVRYGGVGPKGSNVEFTTLEGAKAWITEKQLYPIYHDEIEIDEPMTTSYDSPFEDTTSRISYDPNWRFPKNPWLFIVVAAVLSYLFLAIYFKCQ